MNSKHELPALYAIEQLAKINEMLNLASGPTFDILMTAKLNLEQHLNTVNTTSRNETNVKNFAKKVIETEHDKTKSYIEFINSKSVNCLLHAPTQVGKTNATKDFIEVCLNANVPVIMSCDNKTDQLVQIHTRISNDFEAEDITFVKATDNKFAKIVEDCFKNNKKIVIFCLDNISQIKKIKEKIITLVSGDNIKIPKIALIHDEGDVITKDPNVETVEEEQSESHKEWLRLCNYFVQENIDLKRVFVTATPENVVYKYKIELMIQLVVPNNYIGYENIKCTPMESTKEIKTILLKEQNRRILDEENGVILYCVDKKISEGQDPTFVSVCSYLKKCVVSSYNGNGITVRVLNKRKFEGRLKAFKKLNNKVKTNKKISYTDESTNETKNVFNIKGLPIKDFYQICKEVGTGIIVTIGMDLLARGISFVSSEKSTDTVAATTIIYKPGVSMHAVGLCQTIGRITGTARSDLQRRLYASQDIIDTYKNYNENQKQYLKVIRENGGIVSSELMKTVELNKKISRPLDRQKLNLKPKYKDSVHSSEESDEDYRDDDNERMKELVNNWWGKTSIIGKILTFVYESENGVSETGLKAFIKDNGSENPNQMYKHLNTRGKEYNIVFERIDNITKIKKEAREYINTL